MPVKKFITSVPSWNIFSVIVLNVSFIPGIEHGSNLSFLLQRIHGQVAIELGALHNCKISNYGQYIAFPLPETRGITQSLCLLPERHFYL